MPSHLFLDIETIPGPTPPDPLTVKVDGRLTDPQKREAARNTGVETAWRSESLKSHLGRILVIGWAIDGEPARSVQHDGSDEEGLIVDFWTRLRADLGQSQRPFIVGFNNRAFDNNWLRHRAWKYRIPAMADFFPWERYDKRVIDLRERWLGADYRGEGKLDDLAKFFSLEGKTAGIDGSKVFDFWKAGRVDEVATYCRQDVELTRQLWSRMCPGEAAYYRQEEAA